MSLRASVIVATYNRPQYLELALLGFAEQTLPPDRFEVLVADDGSGEETRAAIERCQRVVPYALHHCWQEDVGFRKARIVNRAILTSRAPVLVFCDGDCVPAPDFLQVHVDTIRPGTFLAGGFVRMSEETTSRVTPELIRARDLAPLETPAQRRERQWVHLKNLWYQAIGARRAPKFWGLNFSVHRDDLFAVNGFDMTYTGSGRDDSDLRNRMRLAGMKGRSIWNRSVVYHLYHPYHSNRGVRAAQNEYYKRRDLVPRSPNGLEELQAEAG